MWYQNTDTERPMESNTELKNKPSYLKPNDFLSRGSRTINEKRIVFSTNGAGKTGYSHAKNEAESLSYTVCKNQLERVLAKMVE